MDDQPRGHDDASQYSPDGRWRWDGLRWVPATEAARSLTRPRRVTFVRRVPGFRSGTWWKAVLAVIYYVVLTLFTAISLADGMWGGALLFGSWIVLGVAAAYAWTLRRRALPLLAMIGLMLAAMASCVAGAALSPSSSAPPGRSSSAPVAAVPVTPSVRATSTPAASATPAHPATPAPPSTPSQAPRQTPVALPTVALQTPTATTPPTAPTPSSPAQVPAAPVLGRPGVDVDLSPDGPWAARLTGFDYTQVRSVVYWIRDAGQRWRSSQVIDTPPFEAPVEWWAGNNGGYEVVTAHVTLRSGRVIRDPGGWHWVDGRHANPDGTSEVLLHTNGSAGAAYRPALHAVVISGVDFWLRDGDGNWAKAGAAGEPTDGAYSVAMLDGSQRDGWNGTSAALSIHVVWPNGSQFIDPVPWVWSDHFQSAPPPSPTLIPALSPPPLAPPVVAPAPAPPPAPAVPADPYPDATAAGASAVCADGTWSFSHTRSGTCSHHGGVHWWTGNLGPAGPGGH
jgi:hypothetical protein